MFLLWVCLASCQQLCPGKYPLRTQGKCCSAPQGLIIPVGMVRELLCSGSIETPSTRCSSTSQTQWSKRRSLKRNKRTPKERVTFMEWLIPTRESQKCYCRAFPSLHTHPAHTPLIWKQHLLSQQHHNLCSQGLSLFCSHQHQPPCGSFIARDQFCIAGLKSQWGAHILHKAAEKKPQGLISLAQGLRTILGWWETSINPHFKEAFCKFAKAQNVLIFNNQYFGIFPDSVCNV